MFNPFKLAPAMRIVLALALGLALLGMPAGTANAKIYALGDGGDAGQVNIAINKSRTFGFSRDFTEVHVGQADIADIVPLTNRSIYVLGKAIGTTNLSFYDAQKNLLGTMDVEISYDIDGLAKRIHQNVPGTRLQVRSANGKIILAGSADSAVSVKKALALAGQFAPEDAIVNMAGVSSSQQVMLEVRFIEASRSAGRELGVNLDISKGSEQLLTGLSGLRNANPDLRTLGSGSAPFGVAVASLLAGGVRVDSLIGALEGRGVVRRLAEPNLMALSGDTASFLAGGEFPFPVQAEDNKITVEFKKFGVGLAFTPTVLDDGRINMKIEPEVSQLDLANTLRIGDIAIPGLVVRRASTTVELKDGQSFAIAGLLQSVNSSTADQLPWIGQVPVLGALFRSNSFQRSETDLVIIVTPRLVQPAAPGSKLATPLDSRLPGNDIDGFLLGRAEIKRNPSGQFVARNGEQMPIGHIIDAN